ncbi:hypothetical protein [Cochlodiniinecator piscidefendens]|uniref:hypothetical protein n=1 Tax=Cochlodiniinecator piscidefendens TaxID=2715756 RepID=UPI00140E36C4|nr:hypothetical protein [Cochlodiniinecator piscidefendens]
MNKKLEISLFGACVVRVTEGGREIKGAKQKALFALLATAPLGRRTRTFLQDTLWGVSCYDGGRQNLRRALADLRKIFGNDFEQFFHCTNADIELDLSHVTFLGSAREGQFMEGIGVREEGFVNWVREIRANPAQLEGLFRTSPESLTKRPMPCITVLPFRNVMQNPQLNILGDWLAEETCRSLSRSKLLTVISHLSSRVIATRTADLQQVRETLQVDYFLNGSLREVGGQISIDLDFIDARNGCILWTRNVKDHAESFLADASARMVSVVQSIGRTIADEAISYIHNRTLGQIEDHQLVIGAVSLMHQPTFRAFAKSKELLEEATRRAPQIAETHAWLGKWYVLSVFNGWTTDRAGDVSHALAATGRALDINPECSFGLVVDGFANNNLLQRLDVAQRRYSSALDINPNESLSWLLRSALLAFQDNGKEAVASAVRARELSPVDPFNSYYDSLSSTAYLADEQYEKALELSERSLAINDRHLSTLRAKITALHHLDRGEEAKQTALELMRRSPNFKLSDYEKAHPSMNYSIGQRALAALKAAGIPYGGN